MAKISEILLASDFSARSDRPLDRALQLAALWDARLVIVHALERRQSELSEPEIARLRAELPDAARDAELQFETGSAPKVVARIAAERRSDLVVTGVARFNSLGDYLLGTAVDHIVRHVDVPVLVVRRRPTASYGRIVVATDLSDCSRQALVEALLLFPEAHITLLHVYHVPFEGLHQSDDMKAYSLEEAERGIEEFLAHPDIAPHRDRIEGIIRKGEVANEVACALEEAGANLLVLGAHGHGGHLQAALGSQAERLLETADSDVLVVREHRKG